MKKEEQPEEEQGVPLCEKCGSRLVPEGEEWICPNCDAKIDFFGDEEEITD